MNGPARQLRFIGVVVAVWVGGRTAMLAPWARDAVAPAPAAVRLMLGISTRPDAPKAPPMAAAAPPLIAEAGLDPTPTPTSPTARVQADELAGVLPVTTALPPSSGTARQGFSAGTEALLAAYLRPMRRPDLGPRTPFPAPASAAGATGATGRWSGDGYLFLRDGRRAGLAPGAQLGGGQAFARLSRRLGDGDALAATARVSTALAGPGAEAAVGLRWTPHAALPLAITVERRVALDRGGRDAWAAFAAGGVDAVPLARRLRLDAYAQAGVVGADARDRFVDGAARLGRTIGAFAIGGGAWGAAQPGAARLDVGPQATLRLPLGGQAAAVALDWRIRVAGRAAPDSGVALTLAAGF